MYVDANLKGKLLRYFPLLLIQFCRPTYGDEFRIQNDRIIYNGALNGRNTFTQTIFPSTFRNITPQITGGPDGASSLIWDEIASFTIAKTNENCENYEFQTNTRIPLTVAFNITGLHLYGGAERAFQTWPIESQIVKNESYTTNSSNGQTVLEAIWYTSDGFYVSIHKKVPLFVSVDNDAFTLTAQNADPYIRGKTIYLTYKVCKYPNVKVAYQKAITDEIGMPNGVPDFRMTQFPIWSTWVKYKGYITAKKVSEFADLITEHDLPNSQLEIDDNWEICYGSLTPDPIKFPDMKKLVRELKTKGFRVTLWIHPFINSDCEPYFSEALKNDYFVKRPNGTVQTNWWRTGVGASGIIDFTNPEAANWWQHRVKRLQTETGLDSFKFDAGASSYNPQPPVFKHWDDDQPETGLKAYIETVSTFGNMIEVISGRTTQRFPIFVRMDDRNSLWQGKASLATIIPELLHMNVIGYPFVLPDMIGGNTYGDDNNDTDYIGTINRELFIRWLQLTAFMPSLQFSIPPWDFDEQVLDITKTYINLHRDMASTIYALMKRATQTPAPVNAPLWWADPDDPVTYTIDSEFLLGDDILVAPVITEGATTRDIYLPKGSWLEKSYASKNNSIRGPVWLRNYTAGLDILPYFIRISTSRANAISISPIICLTVFCSLFLKNLINN